MLFRMLRNEASVCQFFSQFAPPLRNSTRRDSYHVAYRKLRCAHVFSFGGSALKGFLKVTSSTSSVTFMCCNESE